MDIKTAKRIVESALGFDDLSEGLDTVAPWNWTRCTRIEWLAEFKIGPTHYEVSIFNGNQGIWNLNFSASPNGDPMKGTQRATGTGNGRAVYATVLDIFTQFEETMGGAVRGFKIESDTTERNRHRVNQHVARLLQQRFQGEFEIQDDAEVGEILMMRTEDLDEGALLERNRAPNLPKPWNPKQIDPALLTLDEYERIANEKGKFHPDNAYQTTLAKMQQASWFKKDLFPHLIKRVKLNGIFFEFRVRTERSNYVKRLPDGELERDASGNTIPMTDAEVAAVGLQPHSFYIAIYDEEGRTVGGAQDEWGCHLISIADEYKGFGLGPILSKLARTFEPEKTSGGFTPAGHRTFVKMHRESVRAALTAGRYNVLVRSGQMTVERVKAILKSARLEKKSKPLDRDLSSNNPANWLLWANYGGFIIYDKNLRGVVEDQSSDLVWEWGERMIKAYALVRDIDDRGILFRFGGETDKLKSFMLNLTASWCANEGIPFFVDEEDVAFVDPKFMTLGPTSKRTGISRRQATLIGQPIAYEGMVKAEQQYRKTFDQYGEFENWVQTLADTKYRPDDTSSHD